MDLFFHSVLALGYIVHVREYFTLFQGVFYNNFDDF